MEKGNLIFGVLAAIAMIGLIIVAGMKTGAPVNIQPAEERHTLTVTGTKEFFIAPDEAQLLLQVVTQAPGARTASELNKDRTQAVMAALQNRGIAASDIETTGVVLQKVTEWDKLAERSVEKGYSQTTTIRVTVSDIEMVGDVLDAAVGAGANSVQDVRFTLRPETEAKYKQDVLTDATRIARDKAKIMVDASGATLGRVTGLSENSYYVPWASNVAEFSGGKDMGGAFISPERVQLKASVSVTYDLQ